MQRRESTTDWQKDQSTALVRFMVVMRHEMQQNQ